MVFYTEEEKKDTLDSMKKRMGNYSDYSNQIIPKLNKLSYRSRLSVEEKFSHNVTSLSYCLRQQWYNMTNTNKTDIDIDEKVEKCQAVDAWADAGNLLEDYIIEKFKLAGLYVDDQVRVKTKGPNISGAIDLLIHWEDTNEIIPIEIKTAKSEAFYGIKNYHCPDCNNLLPYKKAHFCKKCHADFTEPSEQNVFDGIVDKPKFDHYCQLQLYMHMVNSSLVCQEFPCYKFKDLNVGNNFNLNFPFGFLFYHCKNDHSEFVWKLKPDPEIGNWLIDRAKIVDEYIDKQELPPREYDPMNDKFPCEWCDWKTLCRL